MGRVIRRQSTARCGTLLRDGCGWRCSGTADGTWPRAGCNGYGTGAAGEPGSRRSRERRARAAAARRSRPPAARDPVERAARHRQGDARVPLRPLSAGERRPSEQDGGRKRAGDRPRKWGVSPRGCGRACDPRRRRLRGEIVVEDAREITGFFRLTAAEEGWRIVIVDGAEEMNRSAANALLKVLEEPPRQALLLLVSHSPGRLLPTIRSRCRRFPLFPLARALVTLLLRRYRPELARSEAEALAALSDGSIGRALDLAEAGGLALYQSVLEILSQTPQLDVIRLHAFADQLARADAEDAYRVGGELLLQLLARMTASSARRQLGGEEIIGGEDEAMRRLAGHVDAARWAALREEIERAFVSTDKLNLDRKQAMLGVFFAIE